MDIITRTNKLLEKGETFCLATVITSDSPGFVAGQKFIVRANGSVQGEDENEQLYSAVQSRALQAIKEKKTCLAEIRPGLHVFFDLLLQESRLLVCGAGHIAVPLVRFAREVGFHVTVLDDRSDFAHPSRFPGSTVVAEDFTSALRDMSLGPSTYVVIITRGHEHDVDCLMEILPEKTAYVGLIGSRRRVRFVLEWLEKSGFSRTRLNDIFTPIGIPLGAESPEEIALAIVAELVCVRRKGGGQARVIRRAVGVDP